MWSYHGILLKEHQVADELEARSLGYGPQLDDVTNSIRAIDLQQDCSDETPSQRW